MRVITSGKVFLKEETQVCDTPYSVFRIVYMLLYKGVEAGGGWEINSALIPQSVLE